MNGLQRGRLNTWILIAAVVIGLAIAGAWLFNRSSSARARIGSNSSAKQRAKVESEETSSGLVSFHAGTTLEILGMSETSGGSESGSDWWRGDGRPGGGEAADANFQQRRQPTTDPTQRIIDARYHIYAATALRFRWFYYDFPGEVLESHWEFTSPTDRRGILTITLPADLDRGDARVGMGMG